jgi:transcriptional regulator with XRE-family HTH domain
MGAELVVASGAHHRREELSLVMQPNKTDLTAKIGRRLRAARTAEKLSLSELSTRTGGLLGKSRISNYEQGIRRVGLEEAQMLSEALGNVSATYLLCLDEEGFLSDQERELVRCFRNTDERGRETVLGVARSQCDAPRR